MQKVMIKGLAKDDRTLKELGVTKCAKIMVVGSKLDDVLAVTVPSQQDVSEDKASGATKEPCCKQKMHRKVLDKGIPDDVMPGIKNIKVRSKTAICVTSNFYFEVFYYLLFYSMLGYSYLWYLIEFLCMYEAK
jgi:hypothetical protein